MYKDHKEGNKTRPVVTGCNSNNGGFSNSVSDLLESMNKANLDPYETISREDMLARNNKKAEEIMKEGREHFHRKVMCKMGEGMKMITRCDKLWKMKNRNEENEKGMEERCDLEKQEETLEYRRQQYEGNPDMAVTGEDMQTVLDCDHCGPDLTETVRTDCDECGDGWVREDYSLWIIGNDVISLFPSLDSITTGRIVR